MRHIGLGPRAASFKDPLIELQYTKWFSLSLEHNSHVRTRVERWPYIILDTDSIRREMNTVNYVFIQ